MMATATRPAKKAAAKAKPAPAPEVDDTELEEISDELDELTETDEVEEKPAKAKAKKAAKPAAEKPVFGTMDLAKHVSEATGKDYDGKAIRVLLRKMARDGKLGRTVGEDRSRYSFTGPDDPQVKAIVAEVKSGALEAEKKAGIEKAKASKAAKQAKAAPAEEVEEVDEAEDIADLDDDSGEGDDE